VEDELRLVALLNLGDDGIVGLPGDTVRGRVGGGFFEIILRGQRSKQ
jgi:hypothetical protein